MDHYDGHIDAMRARDRQLRGFDWVSRARQTEGPAITNRARLAAYKRSKATQELETH